ncbi:MAG: phospholipid carrier-dependent glycosyltransferase [Lentisphaerae bacterium]|nr:phospholipid carrier-dependent glycosyltransferase [Lentisphaerota bacterium]
MKYFGWIFLFFIILYIVPLGSRPLISPAEFVHADLAAEMLQSGSSTPVFQGIPQPDIPPMAYWLTAGSIKLFGENVFAVRLTSALAVGITALLIALLIMQNLRNEKLAALAATIYMSFFLVFISGSLAVPFAIFTMGVTGALGMIFLALQEERFNRRKLLLTILAGLSASLAFLTIGFPGIVLPLLIIAASILFMRRYKELLIAVPIFLVAAIVPAVPWIILMALNPETLDGFLSWQNFSSAIGSYNWYIYPLALLAGLFPVIVLLPASLMIGKESWQKLFRQPVCQFSAIATAVPLIYFMIFRQAPAIMMLVTFPGASILISLGLQAYFNNGGHHRSFDWMLNIWALFLVISGIIESILWFMQSSILQEYFDIVPFTNLFLINLGVTSIIGGGLLLYSLHGNWRSRLYLYFFSVAILPLAISWCIAPHRIMPEKWLNSALKECRDHAPDAVLLTDRELYAAIHWNTGDPVALIDNGTPDQGKYCVILYSRDEKWSALPRPEKSVTAGEFTCAVFSNAK